MGRDVVGQSQHSSTTGGHRVIPKTAAQITTRGEEHARGQGSG